jgi:hypothetical protein
VGHGGAAERLLQVVDIAAEHRPLFN